MRLLHISDTHFGSESHFNPDALKRIAGEVHSDRYDAIIHSGDLTQSGSPSEYEEAMEFFRDLDMPCVMTAGNQLRAEVDLQAAGLEASGTAEGPNRNGGDLHLVAQATLAAVETLV
ncbi:MAG: metallophosphoesterase family protein, partial [Planctomycetota bacterium]